MTTAHKILILTLLLSSFLFPQDEDQIEEKKSQLFLLRNEIAQLENELSQKTQKEKESFEALENYNKQAFLLNKVINKLRKEEAIQQNEITNLEKEIKSIEEEINLLKDNYAKYVLALYKKGTYNELESIVNAESLRQAVVRIHYLRKFSERRKFDLEEFKFKKQKLFAAKSRMELEKRKKALLVAEKKSDERQLENKLDERKGVLSSIKKDKAELLKTLTVKKQSQEQIKSLIAKLVEEAERRKREEELRGKQLLASKDGEIVSETDLIEESDMGVEYSLNTSTFSSFTELKGNMLWPLHNGKIVKRFGQNRNAELKTVTVNYGVDISSKKDPNVRCVAEGIVSEIDWLPGYGSIIIVSHKGDYRTVYSHLAEIYVEEGDKIVTGKVIAKIGESVDGKVLHFEIWNSRTNQNPEKWLAKK
ncbi:MAG: peptidoglycan DD-metalloendopeptidase family protein [Bacteroidetes bacterium]|nr:peptidoglycan DD-metalloendopeptidase family protein [Bacteroidota bacterium]